MIYLYCQKYNLKMLIFVVADCLLFIDYVEGIFFVLLLFSIFEILNEVIVTSAPRRWIELD